MNSGRRPDIQTRVLRWLLTLLAVAGLGVFQGGHCLDTAPNSSVTGAVEAVHGSDSSGLTLIGVSRT